MSKHEIDRRQALGALMGAAAALSMGGALVACTKDGGSDSAGVGDSTLGDTGEASLADGEWLNGTTALLGAAYAVDFSEECSQYCEVTLGPCYAETLERQDISEDVEGLPARLALKVVDSDCNPVAGAVVDIWHCAPSGLYSGSDAANMCTDGDSEATASRWFRGTQTTDADGVVEFDTCMPGWYPSRAVHIHFQVRLDGQEYVTSQAGFPEALLEDVFDNHPVYSPYGQPDTPNDRDNILSKDLDAFLFSWRRADDGALVLWKTVGIRSSLSESSC